MVGRTFRSVVMAYVATLRLGSAMRLSRSTLHVATLLGCVRARAASVRVAANFKTGFGDDKKSCRTKALFQTWKRFFQTVAHQLLILITEPV